MKEPSLSTVKKYYLALTKVKKKYVTSESLSLVVGIYPEVINETLSYFNPMVIMDYKFNLLDLLPDMKEFIAKKEEAKKPTPTVIVKKGDVNAYNSVSEFIYKKMTYNGIVDKNAYLSDKDLKLLKKIIAEEQKRRKGK
ncbi:MAG: hypothetical protein E7181_05335 [Erysipelotrichaceae bacterium]|nr:hypothetical protein [Erysipelotrichaceae bacterium]